MRKVPAAYLEGERALARAVIEGDAAAVHRGLAHLGYLPDAGTFEPQLVLEQLRDRRRVVLHARLPPAQPRLRPRVRRGRLLAALAVLRPDAPPDAPAQALLIRRMEALLFSVLGELRAGADWGALAREYIFGEPPTTELGRLERERELDRAA